MKQSSEKRRNYYNERNGENESELEIQAVTELDEELDDI
jgi:hypothetical protein